jgi:hypothetical protein
MTMRDATNRDGTGRDDRGIERALRALAKSAEAPAPPSGMDKLHVGEPILALLRTGDHGDDIADAIGHVARCVDCRARMTAGEIGSRAVVVMAIEAPRSGQGQLERAAEVSQARLVERGHGRWTAVVDADRAEKLKTELTKSEQSVVTRLVMSTPLDVPREELVSSRRAMPSMYEDVPKERGTEAAEVQAWVQMRRQPKRKVSGASPGWALLGVAIVGCAIAIAYFLAIR